MMIVALVVGGAALVATVGVILFARHRIRRRAPRTLQDDYRRAVGHIHGARHRNTGGGAGWAATGLWAAGGGTDDGGGDNGRCGGGGCGGGGCGGGGN